MHSLLLVTVTLIVSPVVCQIYFGRGTIYIAPVKDDKENTGLLHRIVYSPQHPDLYSGSQYCARLNSKIYNDKTTLSEFYTMKWDSYGEYYYTQTLPNSLTEEDYPLAFAYEIEILDKEYTIYKDTLHIHSTLLPDTRYCILDTDQEFYYEYTCSQALKDQANGVTTAKETSSSETESTEIDPTIAIMAGAFSCVIAILVVALIFMGLKKRKRPRIVETIILSSVEDAEQTIPSLSSQSNVPPPYIQAAENSFSETSPNCQRLLPQTVNYTAPPPSYNSAINDLNINYLS